MANYGCGKGMNEENLLAMRRRVLELDANPDIKPTALEKAFLEAYQRTQKRRPWPLRLFTLIHPVQGAVRTKAKP